MTRLRSNAVFEPAPVTRPRSNAVNHGRAYFMTKDQGDLLAECRREGLRRGIDFLSAMEVNWEAMVWQAVGTAVNTAAGGAFKVTPEKHSLPGSTVQEIGVSTVMGKIGEFLKKVLAKAQQKLSENVWVVRAMRVMGLGLDVLIAFLKKVLLSKEVLGTFVPFYDTIKGTYEGAMRAVEAYRTSGSIKNLDECADSIGSGIPTLALKGIQTYLQHELVISAGLSVYTFGKTIASAVLAILSAGASKILDVVTKVIELVVSWVHKVHQAWVFQRACERCRDWDRSEDVEDFEEAFGTICSGCPLVGAFFFSVADYIGTINLTSMFSKGGSVVADSAVWTAGAQTFEVQKIACEYITKINFQPTFRSSSDKDRYGHLLAGIKTTATLNQTRPDPTQSKLRQAWTRFKNLF